MKETVGNRTHQAEYFALSDENKNLLIEISKIKQDLIAVQEQNNAISADMCILEKQIKDSYDPDQILNRMTRKLIVDVVREMQQPLKMGMNVEIKSVKRDLKDFSEIAHDVKGRVVEIERKI